MVDIPKGFDIFSVFSSGFWETLYGDPVWWANFFENEYVVNFFWNDFNFFFDPVWSDPVWLRQNKISGLRLESDPVWSKGKQNKSGLRPVWPRMKSPWPRMESPIGNSSFYGQKPLYAPLYEPLYGGWIHTIQGHHTGGECGGWVSTDLSTGQKMFWSFLSTGRGKN